jgi:hypothetical protein
MPNHQYSCEKWPWSSRKMSVKFTIVLLLAILVVNNSVRDRSLIMGGGRWLRKGGRLQLFLPELGAASNWKICDKGRPQFFNTFLLVFKIFKPFLVPIIVVSIVYYCTYMQFTMGVGVNNNHFEYWSPVLVPLLILHKKSNELNAVADTPIILKDCKNLVPNNTNHTHIT